MTEAEQLLAPAAALMIAFVMTALLTPVTGRLALRWGVIDHPSQDPAGRKWHKAPTPYLGGIALFCGLVAGSAIVFFVAQQIPIRHFVLTIGAAIGLGLLGLFDDIRPLPRSIRIVFQALVALIAWELGFGVGLAPWPLANAFFTIVWIVGITNAFNLLDNMDGVSAGLAGIAALSFAAMAGIAGLPVLPTVSAALAGAAFGFLIHNRHPAKVFMGDAGSTFLGFLVALLGLRLRFFNLPEVSFMVPVVVLGLPILDTTLVVTSRLRARRPVSLGGRDHVAHRLVKLGLPVQTSVRLMFLAAASLAWIGFVISRSTPEVGFLLIAFILALGAFFLWFFLRIEVYEDDFGEPREPAEVAPSGVPKASSPDDEPVRLAEVRSTGERA